MLRKEFPRSVLSVVSLVTGTGTGTSSRTMEGQTSLSRRNSVRSSQGSRAGSRRQSMDGEANGDQPANIFGQMKPLKKSKPVSTVKITFMGKPMVIILLFYR